LFFLTNSYPHEHVTPIIVKMHTYGPFKPRQICFSLQEKYKEEVVKNTAKASTTRRSPLMAGLSMTAEVEKHIDGEIDTLFSLIL
jgi:hypothetical protein